VLATVRYVEDACTGSRAKVPSGWTSRTWSSSTAESVTTELVGCRPPAAV